MSKIVNGGELLLLARLYAFGPEKIGGLDGDRQAAHTLQLKNLVDTDGAIDIDITDRGRVWLEAAMLVPLPVATWAVPAQQQAMDEPLHEAKRDYVPPAQEPPAKVKQEQIVEPPAKDLPPLEVTKGDIVKAVVDGEKADHLLPMLHQQQVRCYLCEHVTKHPGSRRYSCSKYNINIRSINARRSCPGFDKADEIKFLPSMSCNDCLNYEGADGCRVLDVNPPHPTKNMYGTCPYWTCKMNEPVRMQGTNAKAVKEYEQKNKEGNNNEQTDREVQGNGSRGA